jgi:hypothetical protein
MDMDANGQWTSAGGLAVTTVLVMLHLSLRDDDALSRGGAPQPAPRTTAPASDGEDLDARAWEEWRANREASVADSREERRDKAFSNAMKSFRQQPVEVTDDRGDGPGLVVYESVAELRSILEAGGSYSGPLPPELVDVVAAEDKR